MNKVLSQVAPGKKATIVKADQAGELLSRRLIDFGVTEGAEILVIKKLPFGGPIAIEFNGQMIGLRRKDASRIEVEAV